MCTHQKLMALELPNSVPLCLHIGSTTYPLSRNVKQTKWEHPTAISPTNLVVLHMYKHQHSLVCSLLMPISAVALPTLIPTISALTKT